MSDGGSHRVGSDEAMVMFGHSESVITATVVAGDRSVTLSLTVRGAGANKAHVNGTAATIAEAGAWLNTVFFSPEDVAIIRSDPSHRRRFLDIALASSQPRLAALLGEYDRVVRQRNTLLKSFRKSRPGADTASSLAVWDDALITLAADITLARVTLISRLSPFFDAAYRDSQPGHQVSLALSPSHAAIGNPTAEVSLSELKMRFRDALNAVEASEKDRAVTLVGPHRDDLLITLNGLPSRTHSSQGEAWSTALALKLGLARFYRELSSSGDPVIILDDVFAELDQRRRQALARALVDWEQVLITVAVAEDIPDALAGVVMEVEKGRVLRD